MKCVNCKHCIGYDEEENCYWCNVYGELEMIPECIANDDDMYCGLYVDELEEKYDEDSNDDTTERS